MDDSKIPDCPLVTVGIPTFNRVNYLKIALENLLNQSYKNLEVIISDNSSQDTTRSYCLSMVERDSRIIYIRQESNIGATKNFEYVLRQAKGTFFMWLADDDDCDTNYIQELLEVFKQDPEVILAVSDVKIVDFQNNVVRTEELRGLYYQNEWNSSRKLFFEYPTSNVFFSIYGLYKTDVLKKCGVCKPIGSKKILTNTEVPFLAKLSTTGKIVAIPKLLKIYKTHDESAYIKECESLKTLDYIFLKISIRIQLLSIILKSIFSLSEKIMLLLVVCSSYFRYSFLVRTLKHIMNKMNSLALKKI